MKKTHPWQKCNQARKDGFQDGSLEQSHPERAKDNAHLFSAVSSALISHLPPA